MQYNSCKQLIYISCIHLEIADLPPNFPQRWNENNLYLNFLYSWLINSKNSNVIIHLSVPGPIKELQKRNSITDNLVITQSKVSR